ncbi:MAG TPA: LysR substrate-binding domain-containing protein [Solirubrobacteraceae bacterium]|nr:LysR substrate-binding domain-containing protein [Solirubrobacteraceae bacterium]
MSASPPRSPQLDELRAFCAAVDLGGIGRAAQRLHLSQPAVSKRVKALERLVGSPLLERSPRGVSMTADGERLYAHARRVLAELDELGDLLDQMHATGETVHLAISHTAAEFVMPRALVLMRRQTSAAVEVVIANSRVVKHMIADGSANVGVAACLVDETVPDATLVPLIDDEIVIAVPLSHPWARRSSITPAEMLSTPLILRDPDAHTRQVIDEALTEAGLGAPQAASEVGSTHAAKDEAHELGLPTVMSRLTLTPADRLEIVPVDGLRFQRRFCILYPRGALSSAGSHLVEAFRRTVADARAA